jgi:hypothetical protein
VQIRFENIRYIYIYIYTHTRPLSVQAWYSRLCPVMPALYIYIYIYIYILTANSRAVRMDTMI